VGIDQWKINFRRKPKVKLYLLTTESGVEACDVRILFWGRRRRKENYLRRKY
jgi:hypothetical protein